MSRDPRYAYDPTIGPAPVPVPVPAPAPAPAAIPAVQVGVTVMGVALSYPTWTTASSFFSKALTAIFYLSVIIFVLFLILVFVHFTIYPIFALSPDDPGIIYIPLVSDRQIVFTASPASDVPAPFINVPACAYSLSTDVYLSGNFQTSTVPRVLLYRSLAPKAPDYTHTPNHLLTDYPDTNIIVWLDGMTNDLFVSVITNKGDVTTNTVETTTAIENVPIKKVFRVSVVFTQDFVEVYINGNLEQSLPFVGNPITVADEAKFYPVISTIGPNVRIANLAFWPRAISSREIRSDGTPISNESFFTK